MITASIVALLLVQAPLGLPAGAPTIMPQVREWSLGGAFTLKQYQFLLWQPVYDPFKGWQVELRATWLIELAPTHPKFSNLSLAIESAPAMGQGIGIVRPKLQYQVPGTQVRVGVQTSVLSFFSSALRTGAKVLRPMAFVSGRF